MAELLSRSTQEHRDLAAKTSRPKRQILSQEEVTLLESHFQRDPNWSPDKLNQLSLRLNRSRTQIYKWNWDRKKKELREISSSNAA